MRRSFSLALACLTLGAGSIALVGHGCGGPITVDNMCGWLTDEDNCYRRLARGVVDNIGDGAYPTCGVVINGDGQGVDPSGAVLPDNKKPTFYAAPDRTKV